MSCSLINVFTAEVQIASTLIMVGAWIGCMLGSYPLDRYGRKKTVLFNTFFYVTGAVLAGSGLLSLLYVGKLLTGVGVGVSTAVIPILNSEIAHVTNRGKIVNFSAVFVDSGFVLAVLVSYAFIYNVPHGWQYVQMFGALPALIILSKHGIIIRFHSAEHSIYRF